jgi:trehalose 6-phosphate phosphatase
VDVGEDVEVDFSADVAEVVAAVRPHLAHALIATDFDGTLAPLQLDPQQSRLVPGALGALTELSARGAQIAVITGRDARTVVRLGGLDAVPGVEVAGLYGLETWCDGELTTPDAPPGIAQLREELPGALRDGDPALWIEDKRLSLVVHARRTADPVAALAAVAGPVTSLGTKLGLEVHPGSEVLELRIPGYDKGGTLARLADRRSAVLFLGDDLGDLPAFKQVRELRASGVIAYGVGVLSSGVEGIGAAADVTLPDPSAVVELLQALIA